MRHGSRSTLFLIEQLIMIAVFAICAALCIRFFTESFVMAKESRDEKNSLIAAESGAACFKALGGDMPGIAQMLEGTFEDRDGQGAVRVFYDQNWRSCTSTGAFYLMEIESHTSEAYQALLRGEISISRMNRQKILELTVYTREKGS